MDSKDLHQTSFCNKQVDNIISNDLKSYILKDLKHRTQLNYNSRYAKLFNEKYKHNLHNPHIVCFKSSGAPYYLFLTKINNIEYTLLIDKKINTGFTYPKMFVVPFQFDSELYSGSLFETELLRDKTKQWQLLIADMYYFKNKLIYKKQSIVERVNLLHTMMTEQWISTEKDLCPLFIKKYFEISSTQSILQEWIPKLNYTIRGLYFLPINIKYANLLYLFTSKDYQSIYVNRNLNFIVSQHQKPDIYELYLKNNEGLQKIDYAYIPDIQTSRFMNDLFETTTEDVIVECTYNSSFERWQPIQETSEIVNHIKDLELFHNQ